MKRGGNGWRSLLALGLVIGLFLALCAGESLAEEGGAESWSWFDRPVGFSGEGANMRILRISGSGAVPSYSSFDETPWAALKDQIAEIVIEEGITGIGANVFAGLTRKPVRVDFLHTGDSTITVDASAFTGTQVYGRYYDKTWETKRPAISGASWYCLPVNNTDMYYSALGYDPEKSGWYISDSSKDEDVPVTFEQANEIFCMLPYIGGGKQITLHALPTQADFDTYFGNLGGTVTFAESCARPEGSADPFKLDLDFSNDKLQFINITVNADIDVEINIQNRAENDRREVVMNICRGNVTCNGDAADVSLSKPAGLAEDKAKSTKVTVNGNIGELSVDGPGLDTAYQGSLTVTGTVKGGSVAGRGIYEIPNVGNVSVDGFCTALFRNTPGSETIPLISEGIVREDASAVADTTNAYDTYRYKVTGQEDGTNLWTLRLSSTSLNTGTQDIDLTAAKSDFSIGDVYFQPLGGGEGGTTGSTSLWVVGYKDAATNNILTIPAQENGAGLEYIDVGDSRVELNCPAGRVIGQGNYNVTVNSTVSGLSFLSGFAENNGTLVLGENGALQGGARVSRWHESVIVDPIQGPATIQENGTLHVMSHKEGETVSSILPGDSQVTAAAVGLADGEFAGLDLSESSVDSLENTAEGAALDTFLVENGVEALSVYDISAGIYQVDYFGNVSDTKKRVSTLRESVQIQISDPRFKEGAYIVRLHQNESAGEEGTEGAWAAERLTTTAENGVISFSTDRFSSYALVAEASGEETQTMVGNGTPLIYYLGLPTGMTASGATCVEVDTLGMYSVPHDWTDPNTPTDWTLTHENGPDCFELADGSGDGWTRSVRLKADATPTAGTSRYTMTARFNGETYAADVIIDIVDLGENAPTDVRLSYATFDPETSILGTPVEISDGMADLALNAVYALHADWVFPSEGGESGLISNGQNLFFEGYTDKVEVLYNEKWNYHDSNGNLLFTSQDLLFRTKMDGIFSESVSFKIDNTNLKIKVPVTLYIGSASPDGATAQLVRLYRNIGESYLLRIEGRGDFTGFTPTDGTAWSDISGKIDYVVIGKGITGLGDSSLSGLKAGVRMDFLGNGVPSNLANALAGNSEVVGRYYSAWSEKPELSNVTWKHLPYYYDYFKNQYDGAPLLVYGSGNNWEYAERTTGNRYRMTAEEAAEVFRLSGWETSLEALPTDTDFEMLCNNWQYNHSTEFTNVMTEEAAKTISIPEGLSSQVSIKCSAPNLSVTISNSNPNLCLAIEAGTVTCNGIVRDLNLANDASQAVPSPANVTVIGDVNTLRVTGGQKSTRFTGMLRVQGTVHDGTVSGEGSFRIPNIEADIPADNLISVQMTNLADLGKPIIANGVVDASLDKIESATLTKIDYILEPNWDSETEYYWYAKVPFYSGRIKLTDYKPDFSVSDIAWCDVNKIKENGTTGQFYSNLEVRSYSESTPLELNSGEAGMGLYEVQITGSNVNVKCPTMMLVCDRKNNVTVDAPVLYDIDLNAAISGNLNLGANGNASVIYKRFSAETYSNTWYYTDSIQGPCTVMENGALKVMSHKIGANVSVILPADSEVTRAVDGLEAGLKAGLDINDSSENALSGAEGAALTQLLEGAEKIDRIVDLSIMVYSGAPSGETVSQLNKPIEIKLSDGETHDGMRIIRLHDNGSGQVQAEALESTIDDGNVITFESNLFSKYAITSGWDEGAQTQAVIRIPSSVTVITEEAFRGTAGDRYVIPAGVTAIQGYAFANLEKPAVIVIPDSVTEIADTAFENSLVTIECQVGSPADQWAKLKNLQTVH